MSTTYQDTFTGADGNLTGHVADAGFGTWGGPSVGRRTFTCASDRVTIAENGTFQFFENAVGNAVTAYTSSADAYWEISIPASVTAMFQVLLKVGTADFGFDVDPTGGSGGGPLWDLYGLDGYWLTDGVNPSGMAVGSAFRYGVAHDVVAGTVRAYSEPYGGGARTYLGAAQATTTTFASGALKLFASFSNAFSGGYLDNLTIVTANVAVPADPTKSTVALGAPSGGGGFYVGQTATATLTAKDSSGNPITAGGETVVFGGTGFTAGATTDVGNGTYTATLTATTAGAGAVSATIGGVAVTTTMPTATLLSVPTATSTAAMSPSSNFYAGRTATVTLTSPDGVGGLTVVFGTSGGTSVVTFGAVTDVGNGTYTATATAVTAGTATTLTATLDGVAASAGMPSLSVPTNPTPAARAATAGALTYQSATDVAKWQAARQYALRFGLGGAGRWQRLAVVHGATVNVTTSDVSYFALYELLAKAVPVKIRTDTF